MTHAAVVVPTFRRPESLERTLRSVLAQGELARWAAEVVVADNAPEAPAAAVAERMRALLPVPLRYVHEPRPGVATARNAALAAVTAGHVAFIDDDETASPGWLAALVGAHLALDADATFGPVCGRAPDAPLAERAHVECFFSRLKDGPTRLLPDAVGCGCGNSVMRRATALAGSAPFDTGADLIGGEDDRLFERLIRDGARFAWAADAWVDEEVPASRANARYLMERAFVRGQGPPRKRLRRSPPDRLGAAAWMAVGVAQAGLHGTAAGALRLAGRDGWLPQAERAAAGLGKVVWWPQVGLYGGPPAAAARSDAPVTPRPD